MDTHTPTHTHTHTHYDICRVSWQEFKVNKWKKSLQPCHLSPDTVLFLLSLLQFYRYLQHTLWTGLVFKNQQISSEPQSPTQYRIWDSYSLSARSVTHQRTLLQTGLQQNKYLSSSHSLHCFNHCIGKIGASLWYLKAVNCQMTLRQLQTLTLTYFPLRNVFCVMWF